MTEAGVALAALLVSGTAFIISGALFLRGSVIRALPPDHILMYRETGPNGSQLWLALPINLVNTASPDYGDVAERASLRLGGPDGPRFTSIASIERVQVNPADRAVMARHVERAVENCPVGARCLPAMGLYVIERPYRPLDVPGGSSRSDYLSFVLADWSCEGPAAVCAPFVNYATGVAWMRRQPTLQAQVDLDFVSDRRHRLVCRLDERFASKARVLDYMDRTGWVMPMCRVSRME